MPDENNQTTVDAAPSSGAITTTEQVASDSATFDTQADAQQYLDDVAAAADAAGDTFESNGPTEVPATTKHPDTAQTAVVAEESQGDFATQAEAEAWAADQTKGYANTHTTQYDVTIGTATNAPTQEEDGDPVLVSDTTTPFEPYNTQEDAYAAWLAAYEPSTELHQVTLSRIIKTVTPGTLLMKPQTGELTTLGDSASEYRIPAGNFIVVKQATWYAIWTPGEASAKDFASLWGDPLLDGKEFAGMNYGFNKDFTNIGSKGAGRYWVTNEDPRLYVLHVAAANSGKRAASHASTNCWNPCNPGGSDKISHADYGQLQWTCPSASYSFTKRVQDYEQKYKDVDHWSISYQVKATPLVPDASTWTASYKQAHTETVADYKWQAG